MLLSEGFLREQIIGKGILFHSDVESQIMNENMQLAKSKYATTDGKKEYDLFLSHSYLDKKIVLSLINLFNKAGYSVYVDWIEDKQLDRSRVTKETADALRYRMKDSRGLAYIATTNATTSKWCPWELGYFDGKKNGRCCILPIMEGSAYKGQEYLGLYPYIEYEQIEGKNKYEFWVRKQNSDEYIILRSWLNGNDPYKHN